VTEMRLEHKEDIARFPVPKITNDPFPLSLRWSVSPQASQSIIVTAQNFMKALAVVTSSSGVQSPFGSFKINRIRMWSAQTYVSSSPTVSSMFSGLALEWMSNTGRNSQLVDYGTLSRPAYIDSRPPKKSIAGDWRALLSYGAGEYLFRIGGCNASGTVVGISTAPPVGAIIQIDAVFCLLPTSETTPLGQSIANTLAVGSVVQLDLTGVPLASSPPTYAVGAWTQI